MTHWIAPVIVCLIGIATGLLLRLVDRKVDSTNHERTARKALAVARRAAHPLQPDTWERLDGRMVGSASARLVEAVADHLLGTAGIEVELEHGKIAGNIYQTFWRWRHAAGWASEVSQIDLPLDYERGSARPSTAATITMGRKIYITRLLELRVAHDPEADLCRSMDNAREAAFIAVGEALRDYSTRFKIAPDRAIRDFTGIMAPTDIELTVSMLTATQIAGLWFRLLCNLPEQSVKFEAGESPKKRRRGDRSVQRQQVDDELPDMIVRTESHG